MAQDPKYSETAAEIIKRIEEGEEASTSTLVIAQVCGYLKWKRRPDVIPRFLSLLLSFPNVNKIETTFSDFVQARELIAKQNIECKLWDDLVIASQMKRLNIKEIYSNDEDFNIIPNVKRIFR